MTNYKCALCEKEETNIQVVLSWQLITMVGWVCTDHNLDDIEKIRDILIPTIKNMILEKISDSLRNTIDNII